jgi:hypothetical protein
MVRSQGTATEALRPSRAAQQPAEHIFLFEHIVSLVIILSLSWYVIVFHNKWRKDMCFPHRHRSYYQRNRPSAPTSGARSSGSCHHP